MAYIHTGRDLLCQGRSRATFDIDERHRIGNRSPRGDLGDLIPEGQSEAAAAIGLRTSQTMTSILLPQAVTVMLPTMVSQLAVMILKDTALGGILVGYIEHRRAGGTAASYYKNLLPTYVVIAVIYIALNRALGLAAAFRERRLRTRGGASDLPIVETGAA